MISCPSRITFGVSPIFAAAFLCSGALAADETRAGRYTMTPADGGFIRLDTLSGAMALCAKQDSEWACKPMPDTQQSQSRDIERLTRQQIPSSEWKARPPQPGDIVEVMERPRPERRDEPRRDQRAHAPRRDDRPRGPRNDDRRPAQPHTAKPHAERATHAPRPHGDHAPRPHSAKPHGERAAHAPRPHGDHAPRPHGAKPHGKPHGAKPHGAKPHGERTAHTGDGPRPFNKGPKPHRKDPKPAHAGAPIRDAGGNALPRFLQRSAPRA